MENGKSTRTNHRHQKILLFSGTLQFQVIKDYKIKKTYLLIDMSLPTDNNISTNTINKSKKKKKKDLEIEIKKMQHLKSTTVPVILKAQNIIKKQVTDKYISKILGNPSLHKKKKKKNSLCRIAYLLKRVLSIWMKK